METSLFTERAPEDPQERHISFRKFKLKAPTVSSGMINSPRWFVPEIFEIWHCLLFDDDHLSVYKWNLEDTIYLDFDLALQEDMQISYFSLQEIYKELVILQLGSMIGLSMLFYRLCFKSFLSRSNKVSMKANFVKNVLNKLKLSDHHGTIDDMNSTKFIDKKV